MGCSQKQFDGTNLTNDEVCRFMESWIVAMRVLSAHFPQPNGRAEAAVKAAKRLLCNKTTLGSSLNVNSYSKDTLQYLNTPMGKGNKSLAQQAKGRQLRDGVPVHRQQYKVDEH